MANYSEKSRNNLETRFRLASVSKVITALAILILEQEGKLDTNHFIQRYVPYPVNDGKDQITIKHLLTHTSGIDDQCYLPPVDSPQYRSPISLNDLVGRCSQSKLLFPPGTQYSYANPEYHLLAYIVENVSGMKFEIFLKEKLFQIANMPNSYVLTSPSPNDPLLAIPYNTTSAGRQPAVWVHPTYGMGSGNLVSTAGDLFNLHRAIQSGKLLRNKQAIKFTTLDTPVPASDYGYGSHLTTRPDTGIFVQYHGGGLPGVSTLFARYPQVGAFVVVLNNTQTIAQSLATTHSILPTVEKYFVRFLQ